MCVGFVSDPGFSFALLLMENRELVALYIYLPGVLLWIFLTVPWACLQCVIVVLPDHTHLLFVIQIYLW